MDYFFCCFRINDDRRHRTNLISEPVLSKAREPVISRKPLSSLLLSEEDQSPCKDKGNSFSEILLRGNDERELKAEAGFLKACGTLPETPAEVRKLSCKFKDSSPFTLDSEPPKFHSWLPNTSIESLKLEQQADQLPTPIQVTEEWRKEPRSCTSSGQIATMISGSSAEEIQVGSINMEDSHVNKMNPTAPIVSSGALATNKQCRNKSVHFGCKDDATSFSSRSSSSGIAIENSMKSQSACNLSVSKPLPYPTPLKLTDEMQTPGTVFPANLETEGNGKHPRIRSQYVYSVLDPVQNFHYWKALKEEDNDSHQISTSLEQANSTTPKSDVGNVCSVEKELKVEASLSAGLRPPSTNQDNSNWQPASVPSKKAHVNRTPGDRPIMGIVAAHWNEDELSHISPKSWDGNGIPNTNNKYKEDQKVNWHATPFEERLEKALTDETFISQGKQHINRTPPINFDESKESNTALPQLQSSIHFKPVVSI